MEYIAPMQVIPLRHAEVQCEIAVGCQMGQAAALLLEGLGAPGPAVLVTDENVAQLHPEPLEALGRIPGMRPPPHVVPGGENSKSVPELERIWNRLASEQVGRDGVVVAVGGGVVTDVAGFAAATWMRGIRWAAVPTTLESMVDASVGGKTGINRPQGKNLVGAFHPPRAIVIDMSFLQTLPERDFRAGLAESIKHALISDAEFLAWHEGHTVGILARDRGLIEELVLRNCRIKARVVEADEREERGIRECLNFGHTIGHAIERAADYSLRHGECVGLGMLAASRISTGRGLIGQVEEGRVRALIGRLGLPLRIPQGVSDEQVLGLLESDKKSRGGRVRFVLLEGIGRWRLAGDVTTEETMAALSATR